MTRNTSYSAALRTKVKMLCLYVPLDVSDVRCVRRSVNSTLLRLRITLHTLIRKNVSDAVHVQQNVRRRSFCRRTSFSEICEIGIQENRMKRSFKTIISEGYEQFIKDIKQTKWAIIVIIAYFVFGRKFIYSICPLIMLTGYPCPSCGLTRAGIRLLHLELQEHGICIHLSMWLQFLYFAIAGTVISGSVHNRQPKSMKILAGIALVALVIFYIYRMVCYFPGEPPSELFLWESAAYLQKFPCKFICPMILYNKFLIWISFRNLCQQNESVSNLLIILNNRIIRCQLL